MTFPDDQPADRVRAAADAAGVGIIEFNAPAGPIIPGVQRGLARCRVGAATTSTRSGPA